MSLLKRDTILRRREASFSLLNYMNPVTGAIAGTVAGGLKGALEEDPYMEIDPANRLGRVLGNAVVGAGIGSSLGFIPKLATMNDPSHKIATTVQNQTGVKVLPTRPETVTTNAKTVELENQAKAILEREKIRQQDRKNAEIQRKIKQAERQQRIKLRLDQQEIRQQELVNVLTDGLASVVNTVNTVKPVITVPYNLGKATRQAVTNVREVNLSHKKDLIANFNMLPDNLYGLPKAKVAGLLGMGAIGGTALGALKGSIDGFQENTRRQEGRLEKLYKIQDPLTRIRQYEIYSSTPAKIGRATKDTSHVVGTTGLNAGLGAAVGGSLVAAGGIGYNYLKNRTRLL